MSFTVQIGETTDENIVLDKNFSVKMSVSVTLKDNTSLLTPTLLLQGGLDTIVSCNYMYIPNFKRYYYITDITSVATNMIAIRGKVDVLKTYSSQIRECRGITSKQQNKWNLYLNDGSLMTYQNPVVETRTFPSGLTSDSFVLAVAGYN